MSDPVLTVIRHGKNFNDEVCQVITVLGAADNVPLRAYVQVTETFDNGRTHHVRSSLWYTEKQAIQEWNQLVGTGGE